MSLLKANLRQQYTDEQIKRSGRRIVSPTSSAIFFNCDDGGTKKREKTK